MEERVKRETENDDIILWDMINTHLNLYGYKVLGKETDRIMEQAAIKEKQSKVTEWLIFATYAILLIVISCFHEPWYDEAEAWQMARGASIHDLLFYIPHYEGHPSLWYLILAIPAKLGVPYEWGLKSIAVAAALVYGWLLLFRSPFPKWIRYSLPFHYFLFYQYGVISRPYGLSVVCFFLMAMAFQKRNEKPFRFLLPMAFLCALSGYGIVLAGGICIAWVWDICKEKQWKLFSAGFWKDKRICGLLLLLVVAILIILQILPKPDTYATAREASNSIITRLLYTFFVMLPDSTVLTVLEGAAFLSMAQISISVLSIGIVIGCIYLMVILGISTKKNRHYYLIPYMIFAVFAALVYFCAHHMGMIFAFTIFWLWIALEDENRFETWNAWKKKIKIQEQDQKTLGKLGKFGIALLLLMPLYWTVGAGFLEITTQYYYGRDMAKFLQDTGLYQLKVMAEYDISVPEEVLKQEDYDLMDYVNTEIVARPVAVLPYFEHNFCMNLGMGSDNAGYVLHRVPDKEENEAAMAKWREMGAPDVIIQAMNLKLIFGNEVKNSDYVAVYEYAPYANIWKAFPSKYNVAYKGYIYLRKELLEKYGLEEVQEY